MKTTHSPWDTWKAALLLLDQQPGLYDHEQEALHEWVTEQAVIRPAELGPQPAWAGLARLLEPIQRVCAHCGHDTAGGAAERAACALLLREMHRRQTSLWAWDQTTWMEVVGVSHPAFATTHAFGRQYPYAKPTPVRHLLLHCAYLLAAVPVYTLARKTEPLTAVARLFGPHALQAALCGVQTELQRGGWPHGGSTSVLAACLAKVLLHNRSPHLEDVSFLSVEQVYQSGGKEPSLQRACILLSKALHSRGVLPRPLVAVWTRTDVRLGQADTLPPAWHELIERWAAVASCGASVRAQVRSHVAKAGRWSAAQPTAPGPGEWTKATALQFVSGLSSMTMGQWIHPQLIGRYSQADQAMKPSSKAQLLNNLRRFFSDCQEWKWIPKEFSPRTYLATPRPVRDLCGVKPRVIEEAVWSKLLAASLALTPADLEGVTFSLPNGRVHRWAARYPFEMVWAVALTWLLAGLRSNELSRLAVGCVRELPATRGYSTWLGNGAVAGAYYLRVPVHKSGRAYDKAIPQVVGDAIRAWEKVRPSTPAMLDKKTREPTHFLFKWRAGTVGRTYINDRLVPLLCRKAGVPTADSEGPITSHRARATIVTQMYLSGAMDLLDLQKWLGHKSLRTTLYYIDVPDEKLLSAFVKANAYVLQQAKQAAQAGGGHAPAASNAPPAEVTRSQVLGAALALEHLCAGAVLPEAERRSIQEHIAALQHLAQRLPPGPDA